LRPYIIKNYLAGEALSNHMHKLLQYNSFSPTTKEFEKAGQFKENFCYVPINFELETELI
jgi:hypothetical protein